MTGGFTYIHIFSIVYFSFQVTSAVNYSYYPIFSTPINVTSFSIVLIVCNYRLLLFICINKVYQKKKKKTLPQELTGVGERKESKSQLFA